jgi:hypothetical protein
MNNIELLNLLYDNLKSALIVDKKFVGDSILLTFLSLKSNTRYSYLLKASQAFSSESRVILNVLVDENLARPIGDDDHFTITAKGIWLIERDLYISELQLIGFLDDKFFAIDNQAKTLTDKERIILLSLLAARAFSKDFSINLKQSENLLSSMKRIIDSSYDLLSDLGLISLDKAKMYGKKGNEHLVSQLLRHTDSLPKKTKSIFTALGDQKYILDISDSNVVNEKKLNWILNKIIKTDEPLDLEKYDKIEHFLNSVSYDEGYNLYKNIDKSFIQSKVDDLIKKTIRELILD